MTNGENNQQKYRLNDALVIAASCCEGCTNVLANRYGLNWEYEEGSEEHLRCGTSCKFCRDVFIRRTREKSTVTPISEEWYDLTKDAEEHQE
jgi:hypothetical protein